MKTETIRTRITFDAILLITGDGSSTRLVGMKIGAIKVKRNNPKAAKKAARS